LGERGRGLRGNERGGGDEKKTGTTKENEKKRWGPFKTGGGLKKTSAQKRSVRAGWSKGAGEKPKRGGGCKSPKSMKGGRSPGTNSQLVQRGGTPNVNKTEKRKLKRGTRKGPPPGTHLQRDREEN